MAAVWYEPKKVSIVNIEIGTYIRMVLSYASKQA